MNAQEAAAELLRRARARNSLHSFALNVDIPTVAEPALQPYEELTGPARYLMAAHHAIILDVLERTMLRKMGRCMIFAPPGAAKSLYTSVIAPTWFMGKFPGSRIILGSYADELAETQSSRAIQVCDQPQYQQLWTDTPQIERRAVQKWSLTNGSEFIATGLLGGVTGNRANGIIVDDPISGQEDADSPPMRNKIWKAIKSDLNTRVLPNAWMALIFTRWHEDDPGGRILPDTWAGESGMIKCKDGLVWDVLNIQAKCERPDDPLGRKLGEYLWPEFYPIEHWHQFEFAEGLDAARAWSSLYQQRPTPQGSGRFQENMFHLYTPDELPVKLGYIGASDHAVTKDGGDFTEAGVFGMDPNGDLWMVDWFSDQCGPDEGVTAVLDFVEKYRIKMWFNEGGNIDKAMRPLFNREMRDRMKAGRRAYTDMRALPSIKDKITKCASFQGRAASGTIHLPKGNPNSARIINQLVSMPAGKYDDCADVCGLLGRAIDQFSVRPDVIEEKQRGLIPFTEAWLLHQEEPETPQRRIV